jgi:TetR/AcrR family transcriptional repressor of nem operon
MAIFAGIEGAQLVARGCQDIAIYDRTIRAYRTTGLIP